MNLSRFRKTSDDKVAAVVRLLLAAVFLMAGPVKLFVPFLAEAWSGQLLASGLPFYELTRVSVPVVETLLGVALAVGFMSRFAALMVIGTMTVATYVHLVVNDPALFPLQPSEPIIPITVIFMSVFILWRGAGAWSMDVRTG